MKQRDPSRCFITPITLCLMQAALIAAALVHMAHPTSWLLAGLLWLLTGGEVWGGSEPTAGDLNHSNTGYSLTGAHVSQTGESCQVGGRMKGTPRTCESCHMAGSALSKANEMEKKTLTHASNSTVALDCSNAGCHGPLGRNGVRFAKWR